MIGTKLAQRYEIVRELGRGGMGVVYLANDPHLGRDVAIKVLSVSELGGVEEERFLREAQLVARMDHPSIVPIYDLGRHESSLFFVMPVMPGDTLHSLSRRGELALGDTLEIVAQVAEALDYSHSKGVVHRDIKPENVMVDREDGRLRARVMDFGLALGAAESRLTQTGNLPGTLGYLSPEQILGSEVDGRSDLFSLGTILYECLAGQPPFTGTRYALLYQIVNEEPPSLVDRGIDPELDALVRRCLDKDPAARPERGNELAALLRRQAATMGPAGLERGVAPRPEPGAGERPLQLPPMVGRKRELTALEDRLSLAAAGECQLVLVGGETGMGKSRLLQELETVARGRGFRVLRGRFADGESAFPFQGFGELIQDYFRGKEMVRTSSGLPDLRDLSDDLAILFPALQELEVLRRSSSGAEEAAGAGFVGDPKAPGLAVAAARRGDPTHLFEVLARALGRVAGGKPTVFLLENLHSAEISIEALLYLVRRLGPTPNVFAGTYVPSDVPRHHALNRLLKGFKDEPRFDHLLLQPLSREETGRLVELQLGPGEVAENLAKKVYDATEGNPFFALELIRSLLDSGGVSRDTSGVWGLSGEVSISPDALPETIHQAVETRLERLPEELLEVLKIASVLGRSFEFQDLEALVGTDADADEAVEQLLREGILDEDRRSRGDVLAFASGVVRDVLHGSLSRRRRRILHRRHAAELEGRYEGRLEQVYPKLVHHYAAGDAAEKTIEFAVKLAHRSLDAMGSTVAVHALRTALEFVEEDEPERGREAELRHLLARALRTAGSNELAMKEAAKAVRAYRRAGDGELAARAAFLAAEAAWQGRRVGETRRWVDKGLELARGAGPTAETAETLRRLLTLAATVANLRGEHQRARALWDEVEGLAPPKGEEPLPRGGTLSTTLAAAPAVLDPRGASTLVEKEVLAVVFETLIEADGERNLRPALCQEWTTGTDRLTVRVKLRPDVRFSDGTPLVAADVKRSLEATSGRRPPPAVVALAGHREHAQGSAPAISGIEVEDDLTLSFRLVEPLPVFPALLSDLETAVFRPGEGGGLVGTGPFCLPEGTTPPLVLHRNPHYWRRQPPRLDALELRVYPSSAAAADDLRAGKLDVGRDFRPEELDQLLRDSRLRAGLVEAPRHSLCLVALNLDGPRTRDPDLRRALVEVIRVQDLVWQGLGRFAQPASCLLPPGILGHDPGRRPALVSAEDALDLVRKACGGDLPLEVTAWVEPLFLDRYGSFTRALFKAWQAIGLEVAFEEAPADAPVAADVDLWIGRRVAAYDDPDDLGSGLLHSRRGRLGTFVGAPETDELIEAARREERAASRQALYRELEARLAGKHALLPLFYDVDYRIVGPRVSNLELLAGPPYVNYAEVAKRGGGGESTASADPDKLASRDVGTAIHVAYPAEFASLKPRQAQLLGNVEVVGNVFETLTRLDEGARVVPCLASEFRLEEGGRRFRFKLRSNVRFHDGRQMTVRDVRYTFEEMVRHFGGAPLDTTLVPIRGARAFQAGEVDELPGFTILSANELTIELERPLSFFPAMLTSSSAAILPEGAQVFDGNWRDGCVGTGPFRVVRFDPGERLELEANPYYWRRGLPRCDRLTFELGIRRGAIAAELAAGRLALASNLRPAEVEELRRSPELAAGYREAPGFSTYFLVLGALRGPMADPEVRAALRRSIDVRQLVRGALGHLASPAVGLIPPGLLGYEAHHRRVGRGDVAAPVDGQPLAGVELRAAVFPTFLNELLPLWEALRESLERAGATLKAVEASPLEVLWRVVHGEVDLVAGRWVASYPDPDALIHFFHTHGHLGKMIGGPELDALFERGRDETDPALRHNVYREIDRRLGEHDALVPLFHEQVYRFAHPDLDGLELRFGWPEVVYEELRFKA